MTEQSLYDTSLEREPRLAPTTSTQDLASPAPRTSSERPNTRLKHMFRSAKKQCADQFCGGLPRVSLSASFHFP